MKWLALTLALSQADMQRELDELRSAERLRATYAVVSILLGVAFGFGIGAGVMCMSLGCLPKK